MKLKRGIQKAQSQYGNNNCYILLWVSCCQLVLRQQLYPLPQLVACHGQLVACHGQLTQSHHFLVWYS